MEKKTVTRTKKEKVNVEDLNINENEFYWFLFNEKCPEKALHNERHLLTGEMTKIFLIQGYGVLC